MFFTFGAVAGASASPLSVASPAARGMSRLASAQDLLPEAGRRAFGRFPRVRGFYR